MTWLKASNGRTRSILAFSFLSVYILSFLFEGQILYSLLERHGVSSSAYIGLAMGAHFLGLFSCGFFCKTGQRAKQVMFIGMGVPLLTLIPFFFAPSLLWKLGVVLGGYASGAAIGAWGHFLKAFTPQEERLKTCADVLITSNVLMLLVNVLTCRISPFWGLTVTLLCLGLGIFCTWTLSLETTAKGGVATGTAKQDLRGVLLLLCVFIAILTINSGLMYQVVNPAFDHLGPLTDWYWAIPYIVALFILRNLPTQAHSRMLYVGMGMMVGSFVGFMLLGRNPLDYIMIDTLMLAACGIFDLFWWSILGEMLDYTDNPSQVFGLGLSANVLGVFGGGLIGTLALWTGRITSEITVLALIVVCITLAFLPLLNRRLVVLLKSHAYLAVYDTMDANVKRTMNYGQKALDPLTEREQEVLEEILAGKSNREVAATLHITESTVKTHARNIYSKFAVHSRAELISTLLKGED